MSRIPIDFQHAYQHLPIDNFCRQKKKGAVFLPALKDGVSTPKKLMIFISSRAYIFYVPASDIARNNLEAVCDRIIETFENTEAILPEASPIYIFIEQPSHRWDHAVEAYMRRLEAHFEPNTPVHSFILPSEVYRKMDDKHSSIQKNEFEADSDADDDIEYFVILNQKWKVLARGYMLEDDKVFLTYRYNAVNKEIREKYSGFEPIIAMLPPGTRPTIQFGDEAKLQELKP